MGRRLLYIFFALSLFFMVSSVAASTINLAGSDAAPGEGTTSGQCASNILLTAPATSINSGNDLKVVHVYLKGNFAECLGAWLRVTIELTGNKYAYGVRHITDTSLSSYTFTFDNKTGDLYDSTPLAENGGLVNQGKQLNPPNKLDLGAITLVVSGSWE